MPKFFKYDYLILVSVKGSSHRAPIETDTYLDSNFLSGQKAYDLFQNIVTEQKELAEKYSEWSTKGGVFELDSWIKRTFENDNIDVTKLTDDLLLTLQFNCSVERIIGDGYSKIFKFDDIGTVTCIRANDLVDEDSCLLVEVVKNNELRGKAKVMPNTLTPHNTVDEMYEAVDDDLAYEFGKHAISIS